MDQCISQMRTLSYILHPPMIDEAGLPAAARWYVEGFIERSGVAVSLQVCDDLGRLPSQMEVTLFRVLQEGLTNAYRHAAPSAIDVSIKLQNQNIILEIKDNGCGFSAAGLEGFQKSGAGSGIGLSGMRERVRELGGELTLTSSAAGTNLRASVALGSNSNPALH